MAAAHGTRGGLALLLAGLIPAAARAESPVVDADFSRGDFKVLGWEAIGDWDIARYPKDLANSPGTAARFPANKPDGSCSATGGTRRATRRSGSFSRTTRPGRRPFTCTT